MIRGVRLDRLPSDVCIVTPYPISKVSGISQLVRDLARALGSTGVTVRGWCPGSTSDSIDGVFQVVPIAGQRLRDLELAAETARRILTARRSVQVVHAQQLHAQSVAALFVARFTGRAAVLTVHVRVRGSGRIRRLAQRLIDGMCLRLADEVVAVSPPVAATLPRTLVTVIPNGVDIDLFRPSPENRNRIRASFGIGRQKTIVFAGRWSRTKGLDTLFAAFQKVVSRGVPLELFVTGDPAPDEPPIRPEAFFSGDALPHVHILGRLKDSADVAAIYAAADAFVLPSLSEGMPLALLEALASGLPVIISDIPVHRSLVESYRCGWLSIPGDVESLSSALEEFALRGGTDEWGMRARDGAVRHHSLQTMADAYRTVYERACARRVAKRPSGGTARAQESHPY